MTDPAKIPHWKDMDEGYHGQFLQHWGKRHIIPGLFDTLQERYPDDSDPIWYMVRNLHDHIHAGTSSMDKGVGNPALEFPIPEDHVHLAALPPLDPAIQRALEELI